MHLQATVLATISNVAVSLNSRASRMPNQAQQPVASFVPDRPSSPSDEQPGDTNEKIQRSVSQHAVNKSHASPDLPANPPPTPQTPSIFLMEERRDHSATDGLGPAPPLSPPPSPPPEMAPMSTCAPFRISENMMICKRQAASVHGEWM